MEQAKLESIVLDVLKPHEPKLTDFALYLGELEGVERLEVTVEEMDEKTESLEIILFGDINYYTLKASLGLKGAAIQSVDGVVVSAP